MQKKITFFFYNYRQIYKILKGSKELKASFSLWNLSIFRDPVGIAYPCRLAPAILQNLKRLQRVKSKLFSLKPFNLS